MFVWVPILLFICIGAWAAPANRSSAEPRQAGASRTPNDPAGSLFVPPPQNACQSEYDRFYATEPGVYAYWALCERGKPAQFYDYVGDFDLTSSNDSFGAGTVSGGTNGPVLDGETAASVPTALFDIGNQGFPLNTHQGTIAAWISTDVQGYPVTAVFFGSMSGKSEVALGVTSEHGICLNGSYTDGMGTMVRAQHCGYPPNRWLRATFTWSSSGLRLYVDGAPAASGTRPGLLDNALFYDRLFPGCCNTAKQMQLAKVVVSNQAWTLGQVVADFSPTFPPIPSGGVYITSHKLGTIHKDVLGYADLNQDISTPALRHSLLSGLKTGGFASLRYAGGYGGIDADLANWKGGVSCTAHPGITKPPNNLASENTLDNYFHNIALPLGLDVVYTVNYGTDPPLCTRGGDPTANGAELVQYANITRKYGIKYWEIGNELYSGNTETDFHRNPNTGVSYASYEPAFYDAMKARDPSIEIAIPVGVTDYHYQADFDIPVLSGAKYDAVVWHNYPMRDPITDGATLYQDYVASNMRRTRGALLTLQTELLNNGKAPDSIWITEWNAEAFGDQWSKQTLGAVSPLFAASQLAEYMQAGVRIATWWSQSNLNVCSTFNYDQAGDTAYSWWNCGATALVYTGPVANMGEVQVGFHPGDLTPAARAFQTLSQSGFVIEGERMLRTETDTRNAPWLLSYAATHRSSYAVILINRDRDQIHRVPVAFADKTSGRFVQQWTYGRTQYDRSRFGDWSAGPATSTYGAWSREFQATLPPWSVNVFVFGN
jgi:hypothetical protein